MSACTAAVRMGCWTLNFETYLASYVRVCVCSGMWLYICVGLYVCDFVCVYVAWWQLYAVFNIFCRIERDPGFLGAVSTNHAICMRAKIRSCPSVCVCVHAETHNVAAKRQSGACLPRAICQPFYKNRPRHTKQGLDTHMQSALCSPTLIAGRKKSASMHKHANTFEFWLLTWCWCDKKDV